MIKHISLGKKEVMYYNYFGEQLPLRPLTTFELDDCFYNSLIYAETEIANLVVQLKLRLISPKKIIKFDNKKYAELQKYYQSVDYWIVYNAMKDFQDEEFTTLISGIPNGMKFVMEMRDVHRIAKFVLNASYQPENVIREIVKSQDGRVIANIVFNLNVPLSEFGDMTKLQRDFLVLSKIGVGKYTNVSKSGDTIKLRKKLKEVV